MNIKRYIGSITVNEKAISTHRNSYMLDKITVVSVTRPLLSAACIFGGGGIAFTISFSNLLFWGEIISIVAMSLAAIWLGFQVAQLKLLSRDMASSSMGDVIWGQYSVLNDIRLQIAGKLTSQGMEVSRG